MACPVVCVLREWFVGVQVALNDVEVSIANIQKLSKEFEVGKHSISRATSSTAPCLLCVSRLRAASWWLRWEVPLLTSSR